MISYKLDMAINTNRQAAPANTGGTVDDEEDEDI